MSLYREAGRWHRWPAGAVVAGIAAGFLVGFFAGRATEGSPSLSAQLAEVRESLREVTDALELVAIEYPQAVQAGEVVAETEYAAAKADLERAQQVFARERPELDVLMPAEAARAERELEELGELIGARASPDEVAQKAQETGAAVRAAALVQEAR